LSTPGTICFSSCAERWTELTWASPRELNNIVQAEQIDWHIITAAHDLLKKLQLLGRDLTEYSLDTVKVFASDSRAGILNAPVTV
jgi:hypothetical protein